MTDGRSNAWGLFPHGGIQMIALPAEAISRRRGMIDRISGDQHR